ncbi:MAG: ABC transporter substrate-binding protein [Burkholderiales bacterium]
MNRQYSPVTVFLGLSLLIAAMPVRPQTINLEKLEAAASAEGQLNLYSSLPPLNTQRFIAVFEKKYPKIKVSFITLISGTMFSRYIAEVESGVKQADLMLSGSSALYQQRPELFAPLTTKNVPGLAKFPASVRARNESYMVVMVTPHFITYNSKFVPPADLKAHLKSWKDLTNPFWRGKMAIVDPMSTSTVMSWLRTLRGAYGDDWVRDLAKNNPRYVDGGTSGVQQVGAGAYLLARPTASGHSAAIRAKGAPLALAEIEGPAHGIESSVAMPKNPVHPNAALLYANWLVTPEAQGTNCPDQVPLYAGLGGACANLSKEHIGSVDVIPEADQKHLMSLIGKRP